MVGRRGLTRDALLDAFADCGASNARSFLATGNVAFSSEQPAPHLSRQLALALTRVADVDEPVCIRSVSALARLQASDPFAVTPLGAVHERCVTFLPRSPRPMPELPIRGARGDVDIFAISSKDAFGVTRLVGADPDNLGQYSRDCSARR